MWRKVDLGLSFLIGAILMGILFGLSAIGLLKSIWKSATDAGTIQLVVAVYLILGMGRLMKVSGSLEVMVGSLEKLIRDRRIAMVIPPALIGLLPSPGGAMLSAPMVDESGAKVRLNPEQKTFINFWFRHLWEYCWPLYQGLIVASTILKVPISDMMRVQYPLSIIAIIGGAIFGLLPIKNGYSQGSSGENLWKVFIRFNASIWPIWLILMGLMIFKLPILIVLGAIFSLMMLSLKMDWGQKWSMFRQVLSWKITLLLISVMIFKGVVMDSSAVDAIPSIFETSGVSPLVPLFFIPFFIGLLTGINQGYVGMGFPLLLPFFGAGAIDLKLVMFAYAAGFFGVLLSPVHLCLLLTKEYFGANWGGIYRLLVPTVMVVFIGSLILLWI